MHRAASVGMGSIAAIILSAASACQTVIVAVIHGPDLPLVNGSDAALRPVILAIRSMLQHFHLVKVGSVYKVPLYSFKIGS